MKYFIYYIWMNLENTLLNEEKKESEVAQSCPTLYDPMDCNLQGSSIHGIFQARILEWVAISFFRGFFQPRDWTRVSRIAGRRFTIWATKEAKWRKIRWRKPNEEIPDTKSHVLYDFIQMKKANPEIESRLVLARGWMEKKGRGVIMIFFLG